MIAQLSKKRPGLARRLLRRIRDFISALGKGKETKAARDYLRAAEILFDRALNHAGEKIEGSKETADIKRSIKKDDQGSFVEIDTDQDIFEGTSEKDYPSIINHYMRKI